MPRSVLDDLGEEVTGIVTPVAVCMAVTVLLVKVLNPDGDTSSNVVLASLAYTEQADDSTGTKLTGALLNAIIFVAAVAGMTVVLFLLFKYKCYRLIHAYMAFALFNVFFLLTGAILIQLLREAGLHVDALSFVWLLSNFCVVGIMSLFFMPAPLLLKQSYLVWVGILTAFMFTFIPEWTSWALLVAMALYDLAAVLLPGGPLKILVELAIERDVELPALIYEARPVGRPYQPGSWGRRGRGGGGAAAPGAAPQGQGGGEDGSPTRAALLAGASPRSHGGGDVESSPDLHPPRLLGPPDTWQQQQQQQPVGSCAGAAPAAAGSGDPGGTQAPAAQPPFPPRLPPVATSAAGGAAVATSGGRDSNAGGSPAGAEGGDGANGAPGSRGGGGRQAARLDASASDAWEGVARNGSRLRVSSGGRPLGSGAGVPGTGDAAADGAAAERAPARGADAQGRGDIDGAALAGGDAVGVAAASHGGASPGGASGGSSGGLAGGFKLGLGDFIFYSMLVGRAAIYDMMTVYASFIAIIAGLGITLLLLTLANKALPALPVSIALGVLFYFVTRLAMEPVLVPLALHGVFF